jgi:streptogramin lyase
LGRRLTDSFASRILGERALARPAAARLVERARAQVVRATHALFEFFVSVIHHSAVEDKTVRPWRGALSSVTIAVMLRRRPSSALLLSAPLALIAACSPTMVPEYDANFPRDTGAAEASLEDRSMLAEASVDDASGPADASAVEDVVSEGGSLRRCMNNAECDDGISCTIDECGPTNVCLPARRDDARCECDPRCTTAPVGGMGGRAFDPANGRGVVVDPMAGGLTVRGETRTGDFLWVPNTGESTVSKWDAVAGREIARYRVGLAAGECVGRCCYDSSCNMASRVVVDSNGDSYVANRGFGMQGTVSKIAAERRDCVDRNGNGMIDTSAGPMDVRPFDQDECVLWTAPAGPANAVLRGLVVDGGDVANPAGYPWVGSCASIGAASNAGVWQLDPRTGAVLRTVPFQNCVYGAVAAPDGTLWLHSMGQGITPLYPASGAVGPMVPLPREIRSGCSSSYGVTIDARGRIWLSGTGCSDAIGYDPRMDTWSRAYLRSSSGGAGSIGLGITVDPSNRVWAPMAGSPQRLFYFNADAFVPSGTVAPGDIREVDLRTAFSSSAIGADRAGNIWLATQNSPSPLLRYNPTTDVVDTFNGPNRVYTYSDFTGAVRRLVLNTGTYTEQWDSMCDYETLYADFSWDATLPAGTSLVFAIRTADTARMLDAALPTMLATAPRDRSPIDVGARLRTAGVTPGRFARITVTFNPAGSPPRSPVVRSMNLSWRCGLPPG